jgi:hypothetical protein
VRDVFAALKGGDGALDAGNLPFIDVEIFLDGFGGEEGTTASGAFGELSAIWPWWRDRGELKRCLCSYVYIRRFKSEVQQGSIDGMAE